MGLFDGVAGSPGRAARPPISRRAFICRCCSCSTCPGSRSRPPRWCAALPRTIRRCGSPASCSTASAASATRAGGRCDRGLGSPIPVLGAMPRDASAGAAGAPSRPGAGRRARRSRGAARSARRDGGAPSRSRCRDWLAAAPFCAFAGDAAAHQARAAAARPAHRARADAAFTFVYPHLLDGWRRAGAEIVTFSPLADEPPPEHCDCCWLPGGYPELHAGALAAAQRFRAGLARFAQTRRCMASAAATWCWAKGWRTRDGVRHAMTGLLGHATSFAKRKLHLGYREARLLADSPHRTSRQRGARPRVSLRDADRARRRCAASPISRTARAGRSAPPAAGADTSPARSSTPSRSMN